MSTISSLAILATVSAIATISAGPGAGATVEFKDILTAPSSFGSRGFVWQITATSKDRLQDFTYRPLHQYQAYGQVFGRPAEICDFNDTCVKYLAASFKGPGCDVQFLFWGGDPKAATAQGGSAGQAEPLSTGPADGVSSLLTIMKPNAIVGAGTGATLLPGGSSIGSLPRGSASSETGQTWPIAVTNKPSISGTEIDVSLPDSNSVLATSLIALIGLRIVRRTPGRGTARQTRRRAHTCISALQPKDLRCAPQ